MIFKYFTKKIFLLICMLLIGILVGCLEEPFIEPSKVPFSVLRIGNLTTNVDEINVSVDGEYPTPGLQSLQRGMFSDFFDVVAGRRDIVITNAQTGDTLWEKSVEAISYEEQTAFYSGYYHPSIDTTTVVWVKNSDAFTYLSKSPPAGEVTFNFVHGFGDSYIYETDSLGHTVVKPDSTRFVNIWATYTGKNGQDSTRQILEGMVFGDVFKINMEAKAWKFQFLRQETLDLLASYEADFTSDEGMWTWFYLTGEGSDVQVVREDLTPLPARPK